MSCENTDYHDNYCNQCSTCHDCLEDQLGDMESTIDVQAMQIRNYVEAISQALADLEEGGSDKATHDLENILKRKGVL